MIHNIRRIGALVLAAWVGLGMGSDAFGQRGGGRLGGGGRTAISRGGGGLGGGGINRGAMARPGGMARPSLPSAAARPSLPSATARPSMGAGTRPNLPTGGNRPSLGEIRPNLPTSRPNLPTSRPNLPTSRPGFPNAPSLGAGSGAGIRPSLPTGGNRPSLANLPDRIGGGDRPTIGGIRPGIGDRPGIGNRPGIGDRPIIGGTRPGIGDRPIIGGIRPGIGDRPIIGGTRPIIGSGNRPIIGGNRPIIGSGNRPIIGSGNTNINNIINQNNNNIGINVNRPGWGWGTGGWGVGGWGGGGWGHPWHNNFVPNRYRGWYHGAWSNSWSNAWAVPVAYGAVRGLSNWTMGYYGSAYANPYVVAPVAAVAPVYDYSQPIVPQVVVADADAAEPPPVSPEEQQADQHFEQARAAFAANDVASALDQIDQALRLVPKSSIMHEFRALCLFALGDYQSAAQTLNALLAVSPGWDWTTMSSLYGDLSLYTEQLRNLEDFIQEHPQDPAARFVLAYHYLVCGHIDEAVESLRIVTQLQPEDSVAAWMLQALTASADADSQPAGASANPPIAQAAATPAGEAGAVTDAEADADTGPTTDLVGRWRASPDASTTFDLGIEEAGGYTWTATMQGQPPSTLEGQYRLDGDVLTLVNEQQGDFAGRVTSEGADRFQFLPVGAPPTTSGLTFQRVAVGP